MIIPAPHPRKLKEDYAVTLLIIVTLQKVTQHVFDRLNFFLSWILFIKLYIFGKLVYLPFNWYHIYYPCIAPSKILLSGRVQGECANMNIGGTSKMERLRRKIDRSLNGCKLYTILGFPLVSVCTSTHGPFIAPNPPKFWEDCGALPEPITPPPGPLGHPLRTAMNNFNSSHKKEIWILDITWHVLHSDLKNSACKPLKLAWLGPIGALSLHAPHVPYPNDLGINRKALKDDSCQVCLQIQPCMNQEVQDETKFTLGHLPSPVTPYGGHWRATLELPRIILYSSPKRKKVSTLYIRLFYLNWIWRRKFEICKEFGPSGPSP